MQWWSLEGCYELDLHYKLKRYRQVAKLVAVLGAGVETEVDMKDDTADWCWVETAVAAEVSCWIVVVDLHQRVELAVRGEEHRLLLLPLDFPLRIFGIVLRMAVWRQQTLKEYYAWRQRIALNNNTLSKLEDYKDYSRFSSNSTLTAQACGQCACVNPKYRPLVFGGYTSLLTLLQH